ncbi:MAG: RecQ family ATP-dependent DNA helicase [Brevinematales bacterium]|nr:RecQ family ATP-dependent DNA helicase [Brevinematales bacterium]
MEKIFEVSRNVFGIEKLYDLQFEVINSIISRQNTIAIMPTGGGKSLCYQVPALIFDGVTIVVSPIISLMKDQVENLKNRYNLLNVDYLASTKDKNEIDNILNNIENYKIIYVTPERLLNKNFINSLRKVKISMLVIDEAHCISLWGNSFRSSYLEIIKFIKKFDIEVISAFTATANKIIINDIKFYLNINDAKIFKKTIYRDNLKISVKLTEEKEEEIKNKVKGKNTIIFTGSKILLYRLNNLLNYHKLYPLIYHADLTSEEKNINQEKFITGGSNIMIATSAFGMGIDKKDIRQIIHFGLPYEIEEYFQEIGRGGRDGEISECIFLVSFQDLNNYQKMLTKKYLTLNFLKVKLKNYLKRIIKYDLKTVVSEIMKILKIYYLNKRKRLIEIKKIQTMKNFIFYDGCRFSFLLDYFGEEKKECKKCDRCVPEKEKLNSIEKTILATLSKIFWMDFDMLTDILQGKSLKYRIFSGYKKLRGTSPEEIKLAVYNLFNKNLIKIKTIGDCFYLKSKI